VEVLSPPSFKEGAGVVLKIEMRLLKPPVVPLKTRGTISDRADVFAVIQNPLAVPLKTRETIFLDWVGLG
jgi:hypothetical protein